MNHIEKEKLIETDIDLASIKNRVRHVFNQGYDLGYKEGCKSEWTAVADNSKPIAKNDLRVREFEEIVVEYPPEDLCIYPEYKGKPYFGIQYRENGENIVGYGTYNPQVLSEYLKDYFMPTTKNDVPESNVGNIKPTNDLAVEKIIDEIEKEFEKVDIPIMDKLTLFAKVQNALYKCAASNLENPNSSTTKNDLVHCQCTDEEIAKSFIEDVEAVKDKLPITKNDLVVDCISRTSALDSINWAYNLSDAYQKINDLPSVTPQEPRWIPCSEKKPGKGGEYLLWGKIDESEEENYCFIGDYYEFEEVFGIEESNYDPHTLGFIDTEIEEYYSVIAWMPLPKPYSEVEE